MTIHPKVVAAAGGAVSGTPVMVIVCWVLSSVWHVTLPDDVAAAFASILSTSFAVIGGYTTSSPPSGQTGTP